LNQITVFCQDKYEAQKLASLIFVKEENIQETTDLAVNVDTNFIKGVAKTKDEMVILLDIDFLLSKEEFDTLLEDKSE